MRGFLFGFKYHCGLMDFNTLMCFDPLQFMLLKFTFLWPMRDSPLNWRLGPFDMTRVVFNDVFTCWYSLTPFQTYLGLLLTQIFSVVNGI